jgi:hypothetical protein
MSRLVGRKGGHSLVRLRMGKVEWMRMEGKSVI